MKCGINVNENDEITTWYWDDERSGDYTIDIDENTIELINEEGTQFKYIDGKLKRDKTKEELQKKQNKLLELTEKLAKTDWILIKIGEYRELGLELDKDYTRELEDRHVWRDRINELKDEINALLN